MTFIRSVPSLMVTCAPLCRASWVCLSLDIDSTPLGTGGGGQESRLRFDGGTLAGIRGGCGSKMFLHIVLRAGKSGLRWSRGERIPRIARMMSGTAGIMGESPPNSQDDEWNSRDNGRESPK